MQAPKTLRRPSNWQDFEMLCCKLWGEIWNCPEIKRNGRSGQAQKGVDIYGMPSSDDHYYGIQCKGKDEYSNKQFTEEEISAEIELAKGFVPPLKKLYFATTAQKDVKIEEFVRICNVKNRANGIFEVHLFSWEDIVEKIDENRETHDWYINSQGFKQNKKVKIALQNNETEISLTPRFKRKRTVYYVKEEHDKLMANINGMSAMVQSASGIMNFPYARISVPSFREKTTNHSFVFVEIRIINTGSDPIENYKVLLEFTGNIQEIAYTNVKTNFQIISRAGCVSTTYLNKEDYTGKLTPTSNILVGDDVFRSEDIFIKPHPEEQQIAIKCKLISKNFKFEDILTIILNPEIEYTSKEIAVEIIPTPRIEYGEFEDLIDTDGD